MDDEKKSNLVASINLAEEELRVDDWIRLKRRYVNFFPGETEFVVSQAFYDEVMRVKDFPRPPVDQSVDTTFHAIPLRIRS